MSFLNDILSSRQNKLNHVETVVRPMPVVDDVPTENFDPRSHAIQNPKQAPASHFPTLAHAHGTLHAKEVASSSASSSSSSSTTTTAAWSLPLLVYTSSALARPGYDDDITQCEYVDEPSVMRAKAEMVASLIRKAKYTVLYTGAGISTASGIDDYASHAASNRANAPAPAPAPSSIAASSSASSSSSSSSSSTAPSPTPTPTVPRSPLEVHPTLAHRVLTELYKHGHIKHWIQQNHDGLPQKAGFPQYALNEIHGAWFDPSNPVVKMDESLREDCFSELLEVEGKADLVITLGTSLAGMNADRIVKTVAKRGHKDGHGGAVIVSLQRTSMDVHSQCRVFGRIDDFLAALGDCFKDSDGVDVAKLRKDVEEQKKYVPNVAKEGRCEGEEDVFWVRYDEEGKPYADINKRRKLDLREDSQVKITIGKFRGDPGVVLGRNVDGHYRIQFRHEIGRPGSGKSFKAPMVRLLGSWFVEAAVNQTIKHLPVVSVEDKTDKTA